MAGSTMTTSADKPSGYLYEYLSELLQEPPYALPHCAFGTMIKESGGHGEQVKVRRELDLAVDELPFLAEDQDPTPRKMAKQDLLVTMYEMGCHIRMTKKLKYESYDDEQASAARALNKHMYRSMDMFGRDTINGGTNVFRAANDAGEEASSRSDILGVPSKKALRKIRLACNLNRMRTWKMPILGTGRVGTTPVPGGYPTIVSHRLIDVLRDVLGSEYKGVETYPSDQKIYFNEDGRWDVFRFIPADQAKTWTDSGGSASGSGLFSTSASQVDVHSMVVLGEGAYGCRSIKHGDTKRIKANAELKVQPAGSSGIADAFKRFSSIGWYMRQGMRIWDDACLYRGEFAVPA